MGFFKTLFGSDTPKVHDLKELKELYYKCCSSYEEQSVKNILEEIESFENGTSSFFIKDEELFRELIETLLIGLENHSYSDESVSTLLDDARNIYNYICPFKEETEDYNHLFKLYVSMFNVNGVYSRGLFSDTIYLSLSDKSSYMEIMNMLGNLKGYKKEYLPYLEKFVVKASSLCASNNVLKNNIFAFITELPTTSNIDDLIDRKISLLEHYAGIYHIDRETLTDIDDKINSGNSVFQRLDKLTISINSELELIEARIKEGSIKMDTVTQDKLYALRKEYESLVAKLKLEYSSIIRSAKQELASSSKTLLTDFEAKIHGYEEVLERLSMSEEERINEIVKRLSKGGEFDFSVFSSSKELKELVEELKKNPDLLSTLRTPVVQTTSVVGNIPTVSSPNVVIPEKTGLIPSLDPTIPYKKRFDSIMERKQYSMDKEGIVYHEKTDDIIAMLLSDVSPYLYGPSGCGKTYTVNQICKLLDLPIREVGKIIEEYNIIGYNTATGSYQRTNFRNSYECGYAAFIDEIDSGDQNATLILNEFLGTSLGSSYSFPDSVVERHPNFRVIAAGNTDGNGANFAYSSRHKLDESLLQRFKPVYFGYDETIEKKATQTCPEWLDFTYAFREALQKVSGNQIGTGAGVNIIGNVTTKDLFTISEWLRNNQFGSKTLEKIMEYQYIGSKQVKTLAEIVNEMERIYNSEHSDSLKLFKAFSSRVEHIRKNGR